MPRIRKTLRRTCRSPTTRTWRALARSTVRSLSGCSPRPNDLSQALTAFGRAIRCHRRLAKLAPRFFDSTVINREARERDERRRWMATGNHSWTKSMAQPATPTSAPGKRTITRRPCLVRAPVAPWSGNWLAGTSG